MIAIDLLDHARAKRTFAHQSMKNEMIDAFVCLFMAVQWYKNSLRAKEAILVRNEINDKNLLKKKKMK